MRAFAAPGRHGSCVLIADPECVATAVDVLLPWLREHGPVQVMTFAADRERVDALERHGLRHRRSSFSLARPADTLSLPVADWPDGVDLARYSLGEDDEPVHALIYVHAAWASVSGHRYRNLDARGGKRYGQDCGRSSPDVTDLPRAGSQAASLTAASGTSARWRSRCPSAAAVSVVRCCCTASPISSPLARTASRSTHKRRTTRRLAFIDRSGSR